MSSILTAPVEVLLNVFRANDPADKEALQLTCHRFNSVILQNMDTLPTRLLCDIVYGLESLRLYRAPRAYEMLFELPLQKGLCEMYELFGRKAAIRSVEVWTTPDCWHLLDALLMQMVKHFPSVTGAVSLHTLGETVLSSDAALDHFKRLETIVMYAHIDYEEGSSFWSSLFATKAFRRVSSLIIHNAFFRSFEHSEVDDGAMFDFITDFSLMPADKPRLVQCFPFAKASVDALEDRFNKNIASIGGQVCAIITGDHGCAVSRYLTNMASGNEKETVAWQLERAAVQS